ncbi:MAG: ribonuclease HII [Clostridiales bacterium]|nr:ribonuclease HII [Clostridiales bacterium]
MMRKPVKEIEEILKNTSPEDIFEAVSEFEDDERSSVKKAVLAALKRYNKYLDETERVKGLWAYEEELFSEGNNYICGVDEVGRGPLAGPVVTAAVILKKGCFIPYINDSKKLSEKRRGELYGLIIENAEAVSVAMESHDVIDGINILQATLRAMKNAVTGLEVKPDFVLVDALTIPGLAIPQKGIIKGDSQSISIAAASIIAKVTRDRLMVKEAEKYPGYGFERNKGYGSAEHIRAIKEKGLCPIHRRSFTKGFL